MHRADQHHHYHHHSPQHHDRCAHCGNPFDDTSDDHVRVSGSADSSAAPCRVPIASKSCSHIICLDCALNVHLQEEAKSEHGSPTALPWMDCPTCHASYAFNANQLGGNGDNNTAAAASKSSPPSHYARKVNVQEASHVTPHAASSSSYHYHHHHHPPPPPPPPPPQHYHHPSPSTPYYPPAAPASHHPASAYVSPPQDAHHHHHNTPPYQWQTMDYSPNPAAASHHQQQHETPVDFRPPHAGLSPPDIRRLNVHHRRPPRYPTSIEQKPSSSSISVPPHSPVNLPRKRMRTPIARSAQANKEMIARSSSTMSTTEEHEPTRSTAPSPTTSAAAAGSRDDWLTCRICKRPVVVTCQRLLSGPSPDHEALWPQVRLGKRLAAALRQHNQQHHPDWFMWNVKGRAAMTCSSSTDLEDDDAVAQTALVKALEASFEHLPHIAGVDDYETKAAFLSRTLRRIGFSYAYISYTSSEWTKWQQWKKDSYSRVQIQAKARQLLDRYECNVKDAVDDQWAEISSLEHQEKLDLFQNIFVLPQCIFECLNHGRLPVRYGDVTGGSAL